MSGRDFRRPPEDVERMTSLRVGNIPYKTHQDDLKEVFEKFGDVGDVFIPTDRESGRPRGFAFVRFYNKKDAEVSTICCLGFGKIEIIKALIVSAI